MARQLMKGNEAIAEAAIRAGLKFYAGYPITPQNEIPNIFQENSLRQAAYSSPVKLKPPAFAWSTALPPPVRAA